MKIIKISILVIAIALLGSLVGFTDGLTRIQDSFYRQSIESENIQTLSLITEEDIVTKVPRGEIDYQQEVQKNTTDPTPRIPVAKPNTTPPQQAYLEVNFICQAPLQTTANWTLHEESCEEAALLQAFLYETGQEMSKEEANQEILKMIAWQNENFKGHFDLYAKEMIDFATGYYGIEKGEIVTIYNAEIEDIKREISQGHPVIVPITGEILKNPYYPYPGYHMLLVTGYTAERIITNDNGTRNGEDFSYDTATFEAAMKDAGGDILTLHLKDQ